MSRFFKLIFLLSFGVLCACGKVTQQVSASKESPSFTLQFSLSSMHIPTSNMHEQQLLDEGIPSRDYYVDDTIYVEIKGVNDSKLTQLAWAKVDLKRTEVTSEDGLVVYDYDLLSYDNKGILLKSSVKKTQIKGSIKEQVLAFESPKLSYNYDYYLMSVFAADDLYDFMLVSAQDVSKNVRVDAGEFSDLSTVKSLLFLEMNNSRFIDQADFKAFNLLCSDSFLSALDFSFPSLGFKDLALKKPLFKVTNKRLRELSELIELSFIDVEEARKSLEHHDGFNELQRSLYLSNLLLLLEDTL